MTFASHFKRQLGVDGKLHHTKMTFLTPPLPLDIKFPKKKFIVFVLSQILQHPLSSKVWRNFRTIPYIIRSLNVKTRFLGLVLLILVHFNKREPNFRLPTLLKGYPTQGVPMGSKGVPKGTLPRKAIETGPRIMAQSTILFATPLFMSGLKLFVCN